MSSAIYLSFPEPIPLNEWQAFCYANGIEHSPRTIGGNVYYFGDVQIVFDASNFGAGEAIPSTNAITVSTYFMRNLVGVATMVKLILAHWIGSYESDDELKGLMADET